MVRLTSPRVDSIGNEVRVDKVWRQTLEGFQEYDSFIQRIFHLTGCFIAD